MYDYLNFFYQNPILISLISGISITTSIYVALSSRFLRKENLTGLELLWNTITTRYFPVVVMTHISIICSIYVISN
ncbi:hypothetical protein, partial [Photobacterium damselae]